MSFMTATPQVMTGVAGDLAGIGSVIREANAAAAGATTVMPPAAADEVSAAIAAVFGAHARSYQALAPKRRRFTRSSWRP
ncbi:MAG TPA: PE family protein [Mycobacterium sp.]|nr:PE family protein [Mycobacterium sp.]